MDLMHYGLIPLAVADDGSPQAGSARGCTRRDFIVTAALASGFALASQPVLAQAIHTDSKGLTAGEVGIPVLTGLFPPTAPCRPGRACSRWCW